MYGYPPPFNAMGQSMKHVLVHVRAPWTNHSVPWQRASAVASFGRSLTISTTGYRPGIAICARHRSCPQFGFGRTLTTSHMDSVITDGGQEDESTGRTILQAGPAYPTRLDRFLAEHRPGIPFSFVQKLIRLRKVRIQNHAGAWIRESDPARRLGTGEHVCVHSRLFAEGKPPHDGTPRLPFLPTRDIQRVREAILFEDEDCIVINKPSGLAVQGGSKIPQGRHLDAWIQHVLAGDAQGRGQMRLVHRLDRETSGCLVVAKTRPAAAAFASAFKEGHVSKMYVALVAGRIPRKSGTIHSSLMKVSAPGGRDRVCCVSHNVPGSLEASTRYRVLLESAGVEGMESPKHLSPFDGQHVSLVALWPTQGRTHQLRVHCAQRLGEVVGSGGARRGGGHCFIIGDSKYGPKNFLHFALSSKDSPAPETNKEHDAHVKHSSGRSSPVGKCLDVGRTDSPTGGRNTTSQRIRLCLHALKIRVMLPADAQAGQARACVTSGWREVECVAQLPDHILTTAAKLGINDLDVHDALRPYLRKGTTDH